MKIQSAYQNLPLECFSIEGRKTKSEVISTIDQKKGWYRMIPIWINENSQQKKKAIKLRMPKAREKRGPANLDWF